MTTMATRRERSKRVGTITLPSGSVVMVRPTDGGEWVVEITATDIVLRGSARLEYADGGTGRAFEHDGRLYRCHHSLLFGTGRPHPKPFKGK